MEEKIIIVDSCPELNLIEGFYDTIESDRLFQRLFDEQDWPDNLYTVTGRQFTLPRLQTWHADTGIKQPSALCHQQQNTSATARKTQDRFSAAP